MSASTRSIPPPSYLISVLVASLLLTVFTGGFALQYARVWSQERLGKDRFEQRKSLGVPYFNRKFDAGVQTVLAALPPDAKVLLEPKFTGEGTPDPGGSARWFMFLNYHAYPMVFYTRQAPWASGTLVDYRLWVNYHFELNLPKHGQRRLAEAAEIDERGIDWLIRMPMTSAFNKKDMELYRREGSEWRRVKFNREG